MVEAIAAHVQREDEAVALADLDTNGVIACNQSLWQSSMDSVMLLW